MWFKKKVAEPAVVTPKPTTYEAVMEIWLVNNRTEKNYYMASENNFGFDWGTVDGWLHIKQMYSIGGNDWKAVAAVTDFSILKCTWKTFDI